MTREEFIKELRYRDYSHREEGDKIVVTGDHLSIGNYQIGEVHLNRITSIPPNVHFENKKSVYLNEVTSLPYGTVFNNSGLVNLPLVKSISRGVEFNNQLDHKEDRFSEMKKIPGGINLNSLIGSNLYNWSGRIEEISHNRLLNKMIKDGVFEK